MKTLNLIKTVVIAGSLFLLSCEEDVDTLLPEVPTSETPTNSDEDTDSDEVDTPEEVSPEEDSPVVEEETPTEVTEEETPVEDPIVEETPVDPVVTPGDPVVTPGDPIVIVGPVVTPVDPTPVVEEIPRDDIPVTSPEDTFEGGTDPTTRTMGLAPSAGNWRIAFESDAPDNFIIPISEIPVSALGGPTTGSEIINSLVIDNGSISLTDNLGNVIAESIRILSLGGTVINFNLSTDPSLNQIWRITINQTGTRLRIVSGLTRRSFEFVRI